MTMIVKYLASITLIMLSGSQGVLAQDTWADVQTPTPGPSKVIGFYSAGCLAGAVALPLSGKGYQVMRPSRYRYYGHPNLIAFVKRLGHRAAAQGGRLLIGDLSQPRGGPMSYGHRSHQVGLDVDIWFRQHGIEERLSRQETEEIPMLSMVQVAAARIDPQRWAFYHENIIKTAAQDPEVERIFVNPIIKQALRTRERDDRHWLNKIRPWWGHDAHFHVRLRCPTDSVTCRSQQPPPPGTGCGKNLDQWVRELQLAALSPAPRKKRSPRKPVELPVACGTILRK